MEILPSDRSGTDRSQRLGAPLVAGIIARRRLDTLRRGLFSGKLHWQLLAVAMVTHYVIKRMDTSSKVVFRARIDPGDRLQIRGLARDPSA